MLRLIGLVISVGLADSLNPTTIAPALYLATEERARRRVAEFTLGVFAVYLAGGALIALGPGQLLLSLLPHPGPDARLIVEIVAGALLLIAAAFIWRNRRRLSDRDPPSFKGDGKSSAILGATITAVELPTAFPYFTAIFAIVGSRIHPLGQLVLLVLFNLCFVAPLLGILATLTFAGDQAQQRLVNARASLQRHWPVVLAGLLLLAGVFVVLLGATGVAAKNHGHFGRFFRHVRRLIPHP